MYVFQNFIWKPILENAIYNLNIVLEALPLAAEAMPNFCKNNAKFYSEFFINHSFDMEDKYSYLNGCLKDISWMF